METYIALLRGINVSGQKLIKMEQLRNVLAELPISNISTYIQSGNVIFESTVDDFSELEQLIASKIMDHFGFEVTVMVTNLAELQDIVQQNPYPQAEVDSVQPYIVLLSHLPDPDNVATLSAVDFGNDQWVLKGRTLYIFYADGAGTTKLSNAVIERKLKLKATARNWKTVQKLIGLGKLEVRS